MTGPAWLGRGLRLPLPPTAAHATGLSQRAVDTTRGIFGIELDYTPVSLIRVDEVLESFREPGSDAVAETIFLFGCYIGEVMVRHAGYEWVDYSREVSRYTFPLTVNHAAVKNYTNPIGKAFKRVDNGDVDSVVFFYQVFAADTDLFPADRVAKSSAELQAQIDRLSEKLGVPTMVVGMRTNDGLNIWVDDVGVYRFTFYERGLKGIDLRGSLDDVLYWYFGGIIGNESARRVGDRRDRFKYEYDWLSQFSLAWAKRRVRETAAMFRQCNEPQDLALLPDIGEPL